MVKNKTITPGLQSTRMTRGGVQGVLGVVKGVESMVLLGVVMLGQMGQGTEGMMD